MIKILQVKCNITDVISHSLVSKVKRIIGESFINSLNEDHLSIKKINTINKVYTNWIVPQGLPCYLPEVT